jgi:RNA polymerase sigma factor (sigma-70 family)
VVNGALKAIRSDKRVNASSEEEAAHVHELSDQRPGPEAAAEYQELRLTVLGAISELPPRQRTVLVLRYYLDMDEASIAEMLSCPLGTVKWRLHAAKQKLRVSLVPHALTDGI